MRHRPNGAGKPTVLDAIYGSADIRRGSIDLVFHTLDALQHRDGKSILIVEQNARKGLMFAAVG